MRRRSTALAYALILLVVTIAPGARAQTAIKIVVPAPAGGAGDIVARVLTEQVRRAQGQTMVVENRLGAGTIIGTEAVARAAPDGATLLITAPYLDERQSFGVLDERMVAVDDG
jgi:tripartite-type tricarboxylate transporter receptor subunit TctC